MAKESGRSFGSIQENSSQIVLACVFLLLSHLNRHLFTYRIDFETTAQWSNVVRSGSQRQYDSFNELLL